MSLGGETVASLNRSHAAQLASNRRTDPDLKNAIRAKLGLGRPEPAQPPRSLGRVDRGSYVLEKIVYSSEAGIYVPSVLLLPKSAGAHPAVLFVNEEGKAEPAFVERYLEPLAKAGLVVFSIDPRGMGETDPAPRASKPTDFKKLVHDAESGYFHDSLRVGKTVIGMRALDVMAGVGYLTSRSEVDAKSISAAGHGMGGLIVMFAAAFDDRIRAVASTGALVSYSAIAESNLYSHRFGVFGPGFLTTFDLPDVASLIAPRPLLMHNAVDALHRVLDPETVKQAYRGTANAYSKAGQADQFQVLHETTAQETSRRYQAAFSRLR
jgi:dienelactone hydrolase